MLVKPFSPHNVVRGLISCSIGLGLIWVSAPLLSAQKSLNDARANIQKETFSRGHLRTLNLAILTYTADNDGVYPAFNSAPKFREQLKKYRVSAAYLTCNIANKPYAMNGKLAGKKRESVKEPHKTLLLWSPRALPGGGYLILDASGQIKRVSAGQFAGLRRN
jgi:hypothetical protein